MTTAPAKGTATAAKGWALPGQQPRPPPLERVERRPPPPPQSRKQQELQHQLAALVGNEVLDAGVGEQYSVADFLRVAPWRNKSPESSGREEGASEARPSGFCLPSRRPPPAPSTGRVHSGLPRRVASIAKAAVARETTNSSSSKRSRDAQNSTSVTLHPAADGQAQQSTAKGKGKARKRKPRRRTSRTRKRSAEAQEFRIIRGATRMLLAQAARLEATACSEASEEEARTEDPVQAVEPSATEERCAKLRKELAAKFHEKDQQTAGERKTTPTPTTPTVQALKGDCTGRPGQEIQELVIESSENKKKRVSL